MKTKYFQGKKGVKTEIVKVLLGAAFFTLHSSLFTSCSDWDDHFDAGTSVTASQEGSLWTNIEQNKELTQFTSLLKKVGYDNLLNQAQSYTVWAPKDGTFDYAALQQESDANVLRQFVQNHIARNNYPASGEVGERIYMLNKKVMNFASTADGYAMQDVPLQLPSIGANNGIIHQLEGKIPFLPNIYESLNNQDFPIDSISDYFHASDTLILDESRSVQGPAVNGEITYLDEVYTERNELYSYYRAYINREDSSYSMLVPNNEAWTKAKNRLNQLFTFPDQLRTSLFIENNGKFERKDTTITINNAAHVQDSIVNRWILNNLFFNNRLYDNQKLANLQDGETLVCDSLRNTCDYIYNAAEARELLKDAKRVDKSNGAIFITDTLRQPVWKGWCPMIQVEAENNYYLASYDNTFREPQRKRVSSSNQNPQVSGNVSNGYYLEVEPASSTSDEKVWFFLPNVRSATYRAFIRIVPSNITNTYITEVLPNRFRAYMGYSNINATSGRLEVKEYQFKTPEDRANFESDPTGLSLIDLGEVTFPHCYANLGDYYPWLRIESNPGRGDYDHTLRIDYIMLIPVELYDKLQEDPDYLRNNPLR